MNDDVVSLFSGAGGLSLGFSRAGLTPVFSADIDKAACATYSQNLPHEAHVLDLGAADRGMLHGALAPSRNCLAVIGGPPCQGFSTAGSRKGDDPRNHLVFKYLDIVDFLNPRWFIFENVEGILTSGGGESIRDLVSCFIARGYAVRLEKVNFAAYGLPQSRKRVIIMGNRIGAHFHFPAETHSFAAGKHKSVSMMPASPTLVEALGDLPPATTRPSVVQYDRPASSEFGALMREGNASGAVTLHSSNPSAPELAKFQYLQPGQTMKDLPEELWHPSFRARAYRRVADGMPTEKRGGAPAGIKRLLADQCAPTITSAACREFVHPTEQRTLTLREAARLQSFPDHFVFTGKQTAIATQIGNAVPPVTAELFARHLLTLEGAAGSRAPFRPTKAGLLGFRLTDAVAMSPALESTAIMLREIQIRDGERAYAS